jgi:hypothetical protein
MDIPTPVLISYLEALGAIRTHKLEASGEDTFRICCPFHEDTKPSATLYTTSQRFECRSAACGRRTDWLAFLARMTEVVTSKACTRETMEALLVRKYRLSPEGEAPLATDPILAAHLNFTAFIANPVITAFLAKGVTLATVEKYKIGYDGGRIWLPILNVSGTAFVNVRKYLPNAPGPEKMKNIQGRSKPKLFPQDQLSYETVCICGGETKALVAQQELNKHNIGAVCVTGSEGTWDKDFEPYFKGKVVYVIMDIDEGGRKAAKKLAKLLYKTASLVYVVNLPLDPAKHPKGDINDLVATEGKSLYAALQDNSVEYTPTQSNNLEELETGDYEARTISGAIAAKNIGRRSMVDGTVIGVSEERFSLPKTVRVSCNMDTEHCLHCNVYGRKNNPQFSVPLEHPSLIAMCDATDAIVAKRLRSDLIGIPSACKTNTLIIEERVSAELAAIAQPIGLQATTDSDSRAVQKVLAIGDGIELNTGYRFSVRSQPSPDTQETVLIAVQADRLTDALDSVEIADPTDLQIFQPDGESLEALERKLSEIELDLACNVTKIYRRPYLHRVIDVTYHSPLYITMEGAVIKGYVESLIIGDTGQGKSKAFTSLMNHYKLGHLIDCANTSTAGLIGGNQQIAGMWLVTWGAWPANDRGLIGLEELKRAPVQVIASLTEVRSSGIARINKIRAGTKAARARVVALSNTRSDRFLRTYGSGVDAVLELIGNPEDVRRFDICYAISADDLDGDVVHSVDRPNVPNLLNSSVCHKLASWAWTRTAEQVTLTSVVKDVVFLEAQELAARYSDTVPIVDRGTIRLKLARLAAAIACRTYSTRDGESVDVQPRHVKCAANMLRTIYDSNAMGYKAFSDKQKALSTFTEEKRELVKKAIQTQPFAKSIADYLSARTFVNKEELGFVGNIPPDSVRSLLGVLTRAGGIEFKSSSMIITGALREFLRSCEPGTFEDGPNEF